MSKKSFIDSVKVGSPCSESWDEMTGTDVVRFCSHCAKDVNNLSEMTRKEATRLVRRSNGDLCIRYIADPRTKRPMFAGHLLQITRRVPGVTAGVMSASLALASQALAQSESVPTPENRPPVQREDSQPSPKLEERTEARGRISGTVVDPLKAVIPSAKVKMMSIDGTVETSSNEEGKYAFDNVKPGNYRIEISSPGFVTTVRQITVSGSEKADEEAAMDVEGPNVSVEVKADVELNIASVGFGGAMAAVEYTSELSKAVADEDVDAVRQLIGKGANVNAKEDSYSKITPLFIAVETGNVEIVQLLLDSGAKINQRDKEKQTPIMRLDNDATPELVEILLRFGAKLDVADAEGNTPLILAAENVEPDVLKSLIAAGAPPNAANKTGQTPLMNAAYSDRLECVKALLDAGAKVNPKNKDGETALDQASDEEVLNLLRTHGAVSGDPEENAIKTAPRIEY
ncbi:MAG: ankyrin repeat domain-containing protein [Pyrinomonadaceae bacterium]